MGNALVVDLIRQMEPHLSEIVDYLNSIADIYSIKEYDLEQKRNTK